MVNSRQGSTAPQCMSLYKNKKTGKKYILVSVAIDATNSRDGNKVAVYIPCYGTTEPTYVRDLAEFLEKFEPLHEKVVVVGG